MIQFEVLGNPDLYQNSSRMAWMIDIHNAAERAANGRHAASGTPVWVTAVFRLQRPTIPPTQMIRPTARPDLDMLMRTSLDAITGVLFANESQVVSMTASKVYALPDQAPGAVFKVSFGVEGYKG